MPTASFRGTVLAESNDIVVVEGNAYFPMSSVKMQYFKPSSKSTVCPWKGVASYFDIDVDGKTKSAGAWFYPNPKPAAAHITNRVAFERGVTIE